MSSLDRIRVAKPCPMAWSEMVGDEKTRFCTKCQHRVYNLTEMTSAEAERLLADREGRLCLRYFRRADGRIMTRDCPVGEKRANTQRKIMAVGLIGFLFSWVTGVQPVLGGGWTTGVAKSRCPRTSGHSLVTLPVAQASEVREVIGSPQPPPAEQP
jgi:hypothetical protein